MRLSLTVLIIVCFNPVPKFYKNIHFMMLQSRYCTASGLADFIFNFSELQFISTFGHINKM